MKRSIIFLYCLVMIQALLAQQPATVQRSEIIEKLGDKEFYIHLVRQGETIQSISKAYNTSATEITDENRGIGIPLKAGDVIKIPKTETGIKPVAQPSPSQANQSEPKPAAATKITSAERTQKTHTVLPQETFYGIAKKYNLSVPELQAANPSVEVLQPGSVLIIPESFRDVPLNAVERREASSQSTAVQVQEATHQATPKTYEVKTGETLFSVSRKYDLTIEELVELNPILRDGLKSGQILNIEKPKLPATGQYVTVQDTSVSFIFHRVRRGETLFGLSRKYGVSIDDILKYNPHVADGLQPRQTLKIPVYEIEKRKVIEEVVPVEPIRIVEDSIELKLPDYCYPLPLPSRVFKIAFLLPFFLDTPDEFITTDILTDVTSANPNRFYEFMQFYYGAMLAIDSLVNAGLNAEVYVYNVDNTPESVQKVLREPDLPSMDLIIGPLYAGSFDHLSRFAREHQINIVNPLSQRNEFVNNNPFAIKAQPTASEQVQIIATYIYNKFRNSNIIIVRQFSFSETANFGIIREKLNGSKIHEVIYIRDSLDGIKRHLIKDGDNIIIGLSDDKVFVMDLIRKLNDIRSEYPITCFGMKDWEDFTLDTDHIVNLRLHLPSTNFIDYESERVKQFIRHFRQKYETEPLSQRFAFAAFDITWYFVSALMKFDKNFNECLPAYPYRGLQIPFRLEASPRHGFENKGISMYRIDNFRQIEVYP